MTRFKTESPLVEQAADSSLFPAGRKFSLSETLPDTVSSYGLTDAENVAFVFAIAAFHKVPTSPAMYITPAERDAMRHAGLTLDAPIADRDAWIGRYRQAEGNQLPTSFAPLPDGHPCKSTDLVAPIEQWEPAHKAYILGLKHINPADPDYSGQYHAIEIEEGYEQPAATPKVTVLEDGVKLDARESEAMKIATTPFHELPAGSVATIKDDRTMTIAAAGASTAVNVPVVGDVAKLPPATEIEVQPAGNLVAAIPNGEGGFHQVAGEVGQSLMQLAMQAAELYLKKHV